MPIRLEAGQLPHPKALQHRLHRCHPSRRGLAVAAAPSSYVIHSIASAPALQTSGSTQVVPLLEPEHHSLPFGLGLELHTSEGAPAPGASEGRGDRDMYELRYILAGRGELLRRDGRREALAAGDTVLMNRGAHPVVPMVPAAAAAAGAAAGAAGAAAAAGEEGQEEGGPYRLASLVAFIPHSLFELGPQGEAAPAGVSPALGRLVQQEWLGGRPAGRVDPEGAASLLGGAKNTVRRAMQAGGAAAPQLREQPAGEEPAVPSSSSSSGGGSGGGGIQAATQALWAWLQGMREGGGAGCPTTRRSLADVTAWQLPNQTNKLALVFDPLAQPPVPFVFGVEVFEPGHRTTPHVHPNAHELFFILSGSGEGFCDGERFPVAAGDVVVFRPGSLHGIDTRPGGQRLYCLELMLPNEHFAEMVRAGQPTSLAQDDLCIVANLGCGSA